MQNGGENPVDCTGGVLAWEKSFAQGPSVHSVEKAAEKEERILVFPPRM
jgi:hypothetical protein